MAKAVYFSGGRFQKIDALEAATSLDIASVVALSTTGIALTGAGKVLSFASSDGQITGLAAPTNAGDAATKGYVDGIASGLDVKASVRVATVAALPAYGRVGNVITASGLVSINTAGIDGITNLAVGNRVLLKDGADGSDNGIYAVTTVGVTDTTAFVLTRAVDADSSAEVTAGMFTFVAEGSTLADTGWVLATDDAIVLNTTDLTFSQFSSAGIVIAGAGLTKTGNTIDVVSGNTAIVVGADAITLTLGTESGLAIADRAQDGLVIDFSTLAAAAVDVANDSFAILDATDSIVKVEAIADLITAIAGVGLVAASGVLALSLDELSAVAIDVSADYLPFIDATDSSSAKVTMANFVAGIVGDGSGGLDAAAGVLAIDTDDSTVELSLGVLRVKGLGVTSTELAAASVTNAKLAPNALQDDESAEPIVHLAYAQTSAGAADAAGFCKALYKVAASGKVALLADVTSATQINAFMGLCADKVAGIPADTEVVNVIKISGVLVTPGDGAIDDSGNNFATVGAPVFIKDNGLLTTDESQIVSGDYLLKVGISASATTMITDFSALPVQK